MSSLRPNTHVDAVEQALQGELELDSLAESLELWDDTVVLLGLSVLISSGMLGVEGAGQAPEGNLCCTKLTLEVLGNGLLRMDRYCSSCLTQGKH